MGAQAHWSHHVGVASTHICGKGERKGPELAKNPIQEAKPGSIDLAEDRRYLCGHSQAREVVVSHPFPTRKRTPRATESETRKRSRNWFVVLGNLSLDGQLRAKHSRSMSVAGVKARCPWRSRSNGKRLRKSSGQRWSDHPP